MRIRVETIESALHPNQVLVTIQTLEGPQTLAVDKRSLSQSMIEVGYPISEHGQYRLVELPAETSSGAWRMWVDKTITSEGEMEAAE
ncbi:MAG TPA: hypothetical protein VKT99_10885 [Xanthobacteraceae bacterium]|jgi:hypothetical protein|nr:hypothetical protein [Xanthobacteraceae bacterium]